ncbi:hypothetical protein B7982_10150 [Fibrobacter sp. UWB2]|uniref:AAA family ATPase n=1 Tax=Fibrobacter sp. UWB2 TaxID=1964358 RepID=UPI000B528C66|nr:AAA family ATPase [Fibrobacter sp. UWB2]OWV22571.1 hypothetical protein B7982_10150 [Fibrobacter sp. UWB2]
MDEKLEKLIRNKIATDKKLAAKIACEDFWLAKGQEALRKYQAYSISPKLLDNLIEKSSSSEGFQEIKNSQDPTIIEIRELIFSIVAYCDMSASDKKKYNKYEDYRVIAKAGIYQNSWTRFLLQYKKNKDEVSDSAMNAVEYLDQPTTHFGNVSEKHRKLIAKKIFKVPYERNSFFDSAKKFFEPFNIKCNNPDNLGTVLGQILYDQDIAKYWMENEASPDDSEAVRYWVYSPGAKAANWANDKKNGEISIGYSKIVDWSTLKNKEEYRIALQKFHKDSASHKNDVHAFWQFVNDMKIGDIVYAKDGMSKVIGRGIIQGDYFYDKNKDSFCSSRKVQWTHTDCNYELKDEGAFSMKMLTDITKYSGLRNQLEDFFEDQKTTQKVVETSIKPEPQPISNYSKEDFLEEVFMDESSYDSLAGLLKRKKNIILQGAPGVGKTFMAKRLAYSMIGEKDPSRVKMIQFHQSYSYEDFIMGYRPDGNGFKLKRGPFYEFCNTAAEDSENNYFFIIDEINRGNISKIFGELFMLIENDKRGQQIRLLYEDELFSVPSNLYIIGLMNTADRSIAMIDYALRRRFSFFDVKPAFDSEQFESRRESAENEKYDCLIECVKNLNKEIAADDSLGEGFCIGHSYFCFEENETIDNEWLKSVVEYDVIPLLKEYWFDEPEKVKNWSDKLRASIQ